MKTSQYVAAVKAELKIASDYALAKQLDISKQAASRYQNGGTFDNATATKVAQVLGLDPFEVIADMELERAPTAAQRRFWEKLRDAAVVAAMAIGGATLGVMPSPTQASAGQFDNTRIVDRPGIYIARQRRGHWLAVLLGL